jgi:hypothetical protein
VERCDALHSAGERRSARAVCSVSVFDCGTPTADQGVVRYNAVAFVAINRLDAGRRVRKRSRLSREPLRGSTQVSIHNAASLGNALCSAL